MSLLRQAAARRLACLPLHCREAGVRKAEKALEELTDAANLLNVSDIFTEPIISLWNALHRGGEPPLVRHKAPVLDKPSLDPTRNQRRGLRCNAERLESAEGRAALQDVLLGLLTQREAARKLGVHPNSVCDAVRRLRREAIDAPAEIALTFSPTSH
jgi:hypothetical protein